MKIVAKKIKKERKEKHSPEEQAWFVDTKKDTGKSFPHSPFPFSKSTFCWEILNPLNIFRGFSSPRLRARQRDVCSFLVHQLWNMADCFSTNMVTGRDIFLASFLPRSRRSWGAERGLTAPLPFRWPCPYSIPAAIPFSLWFSLFLYCFLPESKRPSTTLLNMQRQRM